MKPSESLIRQLALLESQARILEPESSLRDHWMKEVYAYSSQFIDSLEKGPAFVEPEDGPEPEPFSISDHPVPIEDVLNEFDKQVNTTGLNPASGGHLAYIPGGGVFPAGLGDLLAAVSNRYAGIYYASPGTVRLENFLIRWMCSLIGYPSSALGNLTSGGSIANLIAITTARDRHGIVGDKVPQAVIYLTKQVHHCVQKALRIAGLGTAVVRYVPMDNQFRMDAGALEKQVAADLKAGLSPFLLVGSAGTTDTGAMDPLDKLADVAGRHDMWFHVDAAYGGFFILLQEMDSLFCGIERSDSVAIDPHKGLFLPYGLGAVLVKDVEALHRSHFYQAGYLQDVIDEASEPSPADLSPELTKHFRGLRLWLPLKLYGLAPFRAALQEKLLLCRYFYEKIRELGFETGPEPQLSVMIYRFVPPSAADANAFNARLVEEVRKDGRVFLSSTTIDGTFWLRLAVLSFRTHQSTIDMCLKVLKEKIEHLQA